MKQLSMKDIAILDAFPTYSYQKTILEVGCGDGKLDFYLANMGFRVHGTDIDLSKLGIKRLWSAKAGNPTFQKANIFDLSSFPVKSASVVIASEILEHLPGWKLALVHLIALANVRLIITVPHERSFFSLDHINFWHDFQFKAGFGYINEFINLCKPFSTSITKIRTKPEDVEMGQYAYLIVVDKRQGLND